MKILTRYFALAAAVLCTLGAAYAQQPYLTAPETGLPGESASGPSEPIGAEDAETEVVEESNETMPATGGAPLLFVVGGTLTAASAFMLRRKLA